MAMSHEKKNAPGRCVYHSWTDLNASERSGESVSMPGASDRSIHCTGSFDNATLVIEGSNELVPVNWFTMHNEVGDAMNIVTTDTGHAINENTFHIRCRIEGGTDPHVNVYMFSRSTMT